MSIAEEKDNKIYTVFAFKNIAKTTADEPDHEIICHPHNPRKSVDLGLGIATGIWNDIPAVIHLSQLEAEALMSTSAWTTPEEVE